MDTKDKTHDRSLLYQEERKNFLGLHSLVREDDPPVLERDYTQVSYKNCVDLHFFDEFVLDEFDAFRKYYTAVQLSNYYVHFTQEATLSGKTCSLYPQDKIPLNKNEEVSECSQHYQLLTRKRRYIHDNLNISLSFTNHKERCIRASEAIDPATVLIIERAVVMANPSLCKCNYPGDYALHRCFLCAAPKSLTTEMSKCKSCNLVLHCKNECKLNSTEVDHSMDCPGLKYHFWGSNLEDRSYIAMRMMVYGAKSFFVTGKSHDLLSIDNWSNNYYTYAEIFHMPSNFNIQSRESVAEILYFVTRTLYYIKENTTFFSWVRDCVSEEGVQFTDYSLTIFIGGLLLKHYCQSIYNNVVFHLPNYRFSIISEYIERKVRAICPFIALLNHSCRPNAVLIYQEDVAVVKAFKNIEEGEEITIAYKEIDIFEGHPFRNEMSRESLGFECGCPLCVEQGLHGDRVYKCQYCEGPVEFHFKDPVTKKRRLMSELLKDAKKKEIIIKKEIEDYLNQSDSGDSVTVQLVLRDINELKSPDKDAIRRRNPLNIDSEDKVITDLYDKSVLEEFERMAEEMDMKKDKKAVRNLTEEINKVNVIQTTRPAILSSIKEEDEEEPLPSTSRDCLKETTTNEEISCVIDNREAKNIPENVEEKEEPSTSRTFIKETEDKTEEKISTEEKAYAILGREPKNISEDSEEKEEQISSTSRDSMEETEDEIDKETLPGEETEEDTLTEDEEETSTEEIVTSKSEAIKTAVDLDEKEEPIPSTSQDSIEVTEDESEEETLTEDETEEESSTEEMAFPIAKREAEKIPEDLEEKEEPSTSRDSEEETEEKTLTGDETEKESLTEEMTYPVDKREVEKIPEDLEEKEEPSTSRDSEEETEEKTLTGGETEKESLNAEIIYPVDKREPEKIPEYLEEKEELRTNQNSKEETEEVTLTGGETEEKSITEEMAYVINKIETKKISADLEEKEEPVPRKSRDSMVEAADETDKETLTGDETEKESLNEEITYPVDKREPGKIPEELEEKEELRINRDSKEETEEVTLTGGETEEKSITEEVAYVIDKWETKKVSEDLNEQEVPIPSTSRDSMEETDEETLTGDETEEDTLTADEIEEETSAEEVVINKRLEKVDENEDQIVIPGQGKISLEEISNITKVIQDLETEEKETITLDKNTPTSRCVFANKEVQNMTSNENEDAGRELDEMENIITKLMLQPPGERLEFFTLQTNELGEIDAVKTEPNIDSDEDEGPIFSGECRTCKKFNDLDEKATVMYHVDELGLFCDQRGYAPEDTEDALEWCLECLHKDSPELYYAYYSKFIVRVSENDYVGMLETLHEMRSMSERRYGRLFYPVLVANLLMIWNTVRLNKWMERKSKDPVHEVAVLGKTLTYLSVAYESAQMYVKEDKLQYISMMQRFIEEKIQNLNLMMALKISTSQVTILELPKNKNIARNLTEEINKLSVTDPKSKKIKMLTSNEIEEPIPSTSGIGSSSTKSSKKRKKKSQDTESKDQEQVPSTSGKNTHQNIKQDESEEQSKRGSLHKPPSPKSNSSNKKNKESRETIPTGRTCRDVSAGMKSALKKRKKRR